jgi:phytoene dehydrogenase-like protein
LVAATLLAQAGRSVLVLERGQHVGGAAVSAAPFPGVEARLSRFSYLVSLFPAFLISQLGLPFRLQTRPIASYTPSGHTGLGRRRAADSPLHDGDQRPGGRSAGWFSPMR